MMQCDVTWYGIWCGVLVVLSTTLLFSTLHACKHFHMVQRVYYKIDHEGLYDTVSCSTVRHDTAQYSIA